jgi:hypothetical protein
MVISYYRLSVVGRSSLRIVKGSLGGAGRPYHCAIETRAVRYFHPIPGFVILAADYRKKGS